MTGPVHLFLFIFKFLARIITGHECVLCHGLLSPFNPDSVPLCAECFRNLDFADDPVCAYCGIPLISEKQYCMKCRDRDFHHQGNRSLFMYKGKERLLLDAYKFNDSRILASVFAGLLIERILDGYENYIVIPVPSSPLTVKKRGWGHMEETGKYLEKNGVTVIRGSLKKANTASQKMLSREKRFENSAVLFRHSPDPALEGKNILLVDDVYTTGATLDACSLALAASAPAKIKCLTLYRD